VYVLIESICVEKVLLFKSLIMNSDSSGSTGERDLLIVSFIWKILMEYTPGGRVLEDNTSH
jgi:hypothetical protein